ncbi:nucleotidyltransferase domain-containing protein [Pseudomonas carnis]|uniref:anti-phage Hailong system nucleotidyltransferase HalB n=1 Tax=Pseudomonas carnis TaxID=2487355 RepID=UPI00190E0269|nr:nucleotidyltransferase domain-containing protein [Pseudomonas carnis]MBK3471735.1 nucleotidyltransferase domain-containing protein [Pseudomonas carnis]
MPIISLSVYGSRAREDHSDESDTDLFAITDDEQYAMIIEGSTNIACYPLDQAISRAEGGDLFFLHITTEGKPIYDPTGVFPKIQKHFCKKPNYSTEINNASDLGYALIAHSEHINNYYLLNKRLAWCLRTILIAKSAEMNRPTFSKEGLSRLFDDKTLINLISLKDCQSFASKAYPLFRSAFITYGAPPKKDLPNDTNALADYFLKSENTMGVKTARLLNRDINSESYD